MVQGKWPRDKNSLTKATFQTLNRRHTGRFCSNIFLFNSSGCTSLTFRIELGFFIQIQIHSGITVTKFQSY